jgi:hypothetical protein
LTASQLIAIAPVRGVCVTRRELVRRLDDRQQDPARRHGEWLIDPLRAETLAATEHQRIRRVPGNWAHAFVVFAGSKNSDMQPWINALPHGFWAECGFARPPKPSTIRRRFIELQESKNMTALVDALQRAVQRTRVYRPDIGTAIMIDATLAPSHAQPVCLGAVTGAGEAAARLFATRGLADHLERKGLPYEPFDDFFDIAAALASTPA